MIRKSYFLLALALAAAAIGVPVAQATVTSPYKYLGHPTSQAGDRAATGAQLEAASTSSPQVAGSTGFQWADAGIGAGITLGIVLILAGAVTGLFISRQDRRQQSVHA